MRRTLALLAAILGVLAISACGGSSGGTAATGSGGGGSSTASGGSGPPKYDGKPVTITFWHPFTQRQADDMNAIIADFEKQYPTIKVISKGGISDQNIIAAIRSGNPPDVAFSQSSDNLGEYCGTGAWINLTPYMNRDGVSPSAFPGAVQQYTEFNGDRCAVPDLADAYGLYYNKTMFAKAGITAPPKTFDELTADAKKLTVFNPDGSIKIAGFVPTSTYYENAIAHYAPLWNAHWDMNGKSAFALDPHWAAYLTWEKQLIDWYGVQKLTKFVSGAGNEFSPQNDFERGRVAMNMDGEWRVAFVKSDNAKIDYGTAPMPVDPAQPQLYGAGYTTGNVLGIPRDSSHKAAAWLLLKYLSFDKAAIEKFAEGLLNVPTLTSALTDPVLTSDPHFAVFLQIFGNPNTASDPITAIGSANQTIAGNWQQKWEAGSVGNLTAGLQSVDSAINAQVANSTIGKAP